MKKIYFVGINGIGMSGLAKLMKCKGYEVLGSDITVNYITDELKTLGIKVYDFHDSSNVENSDTIVISSAISENNPEYKYAKENGIRIIKRGELLAEMLNREKGVSIAGTHGKTTTTSMLATTMLSKDPTIIVGGILPEIHSNAVCGKSEYFIAESDESDNTFLFMNPKYSVITNIEADHLENHGNFENLKLSFKKFMENTEEEVIVCNECSNIRELIKDIKDTKVTTYGIQNKDKNKDANILATNIRVENRKTFYEVIISGKNYGTFSLSIPGNHNILNSLPVIYLSIKFGVELDEIKEKLSKFKGTKRRYDVIYDDTNNNVKIIDDYAHHPTEIKATLAGLNSIETGYKTVIFQPHRYSRMKFLLNEFKDVFNTIDKVILLPVYSAGEKDSYNVNEDNLQEIIENKNSCIVRNKEEIKSEIFQTKENKIFIFMGAGDISKLAHEISEKMEKGIA